MRLAGENDQYSIIFNYALQRNLISNIDHENTINEIARDVLNNATVL